MIHINDKTYQIVHDHRDAWNPEAFRDRYSEVLDRYDYIVGDWGYSQLRLKGFYKDGSSKANKDTTIASLQDYLNEYCNFGCAYFVIERLANPNRSVEQEDVLDTEELDAKEDIGKPDMGYPPNRHRQQVRDEVVANNASNERQDTVDNGRYEYQQRKDHNHKNRDRRYRNGRPDKPSGQMQQEQLDR